MGGIDAGFVLAATGAVAVGVVAGVASAAGGYQLFEKATDAAFNLIRDRLSPDKVIEVDLNGDFKDLLDQFFAERTDKTDEPTLISEQVAANAAVEFERLKIQTELEERRFRLLREYAAQGLAQSKVSFKFSIFAAMFGFMVIVAGIVFAIVRREFVVAVIPVISGAIVEGVSALFFVQDRLKQEGMVSFFDRLREDRKIEDAVTLLQSVESASIRDRLKTLLSIHFAGIGQDEKLFGQLVNSAQSRESAGQGQSAIRTTRSTTYRIVTRRRVRKRVS
jgi:hypothetical protein